MKRLLIFALALSVMMTMASFAQDMPKDGGTTKAAAACKKSLKGTVRRLARSDLRYDKDQKAWDVASSEALKDTRVIMFNWRPCMRQGVRFMYEREDAQG